MTTLRPATIRRQLLQATDAAEGRRMRRKRTTTPDPEEFEAWLLAQVPAGGGSAGATRAMAQQIWDEWQFALASGGFREWLVAGAPSDDTRAGTDKGLDPRWSPSLWLEMLRRIGPLVQNAQDFDDIALDPIVEDVVLDVQNSASGKEPRHAGADLWKVG